ncbi:MAG: TonB family protein [Sphingomonadaceae bacterium]|nr:TonB family protein [Sphingomonadaceae bacterium]
MQPAVATPVIAGMASIAGMRWGERRRVRPASLLAALILQALVVAGFVLGLSSPIKRAVERRFEALQLEPPRAPKPPPERPRPRPHVAPRRAARAAPSAARARPVEVVAPPPVLPVVNPPPIASAPLAAAGPDPSAGAAAAGPGTGAGGEGIGLGAGGSGTGDGGGGGEGTGAVWIKGRIRNSDFPRDALRAGEEGRLTTRYTVGVDGRVTECAVVRSSGSAVLDATTCRLIRERFRFRAARDAEGRPRPDTILEDHEWIIRRSDAPREEVWN